MVRHGVVSGLDGGAQQKVPSGASPTKREAQDWSAAFTCAPPPHWLPWLCGAFPRRAAGGEHLADKGEPSRRILLTSASGKIAIPQERDRWQKTAGLSGRTAQALLQPPQICTHSRHFNHAVRFYELRLQPRPPSPDWGTEERKEMLFGRSGVSAVCRGHDGQASLLLTLWVFLVRFRGGCWPSPWGLRL